MPTRLVLLLSLLLLGACTTDPKTLFDSQVRTSTTPLATSLAEAVRLAEAAPLQVDPGRAPQYQIGQDQPRLLLHDLPSNYRVFQITLEEQQLYNLQIVSDCISCSGSARYGLKPAVFLLDANGTLVDEHPSQALTGARGVSLRMSGLAPHSGDYYLLVAADNRALGYEIVLEHRGVNQPMLLTPNSVGRRRPSPMRSYPIGEIRVFASTRR